MLASIHPLGERAKHNRWEVTAAFYLVGSMAGGAALGAALGSTGFHGGALVVAALCVVAAGFDASGRVVPGVHRQVNEDWMGRYRGWAYGIGFGFQLGTGVVTIVTTAAVYLTFALAALSGSARAGAAIGAAFGLARAAPVLALAGVRAPHALRRAHERLAMAAGWARRLTVVALLGTAVGALR